MNARLAFTLAIQSAGHAFAGALLVALAALAVTLAAYAAAGAAPLAALAYAALAVPFVWSAVSPLRAALVLAARAVLAADKDA